MEWVDIVTQTPAVAKSFDLSVTKPFGASDGPIGLTIVAAGTSLPEH